MIALFTTSSALQCNPDRSLFSRVHFKNFEVVAHKVLSFFRYDTDAEERGLTM